MSQPDSLFPSKIVVVKPEQNPFISHVILLNIFQVTVASGNLSRYGQEKSAPKNSEETDTVISLLRI